MQAQEFLNKDSLQRIVFSGKLDTLVVDACYRYGEFFETDQPDTALLYFKKGIEISKKINYPKGEAFASSYLLPIYNNRGQFKEGLQVALNALDIYKKYGTPKDLSAGYINAGSEWEYFSEYQLAADNYLKALPYATAINNQKHLRVINNNLASVYINIHNYKKGVEYATAAHSIGTAMQDDYAQASSLINIATAQNYLKEHINAINRFDEVEQIGVKSKDTILLLDAWNGKGGTHVFLKDYTKAKTYFELALTTATELQTPEYAFNARKGLGDVYYGLNNFSAAFENYMAGAAIAKELGAKNELQDLLFQCAIMQERLGNSGNALSLYKEAQKWKDSVFLENNQLSISTLEIKYESEKKETQIKLQQAEIKGKKNLIYLFGSIAAAMILLSFVGYRNYRHRQKLQQLKIAELEKEKQLTATEAVLKGEEQERTRLAKDLHDGLGGMLSGIKYNLNAMKGNMIMTPDNALAFERSVDMLDSSIQEMRRVAHNMMPEVLVKFGLDTALEQFCSDINQSGALKINYQSMGLKDAAIEQITAITIYRIVQELINNTIKHAVASTALVQVNKSDGTLSVTVEDNGKGFDTALLSRAKGIGWTNIQHRVDFLKGKLDVQSGMGKGTFVHIEI
jgi:signal transduction histidine kinase